MKGSLTAFVAALVSVGAPVVGGAASDVPAASPLPVSPTPVAVNLGYVRPTARSTVTQPALDRYAGDLRDRLARAVSVPIVLANEVRDENGAGVATCNLQHLVGFVEPGRQWQVTASLVSVHARLYIVDCSGNMFYAGDVLRSVQRKKNVLPYLQVDAAGSYAAAGLLRDFESFKRAHTSAWERMIRTGSLTDAAPSPAPTSKP